MPRQLTINQRAGEQNCAKNHQRRPRPAPTKAPRQKGSPGEKARHHSQCIQSPPCWTWCRKQKRHPPHAAKKRQDQGGVKTACCECEPVSLWHEQSNQGANDLRQNAGNTKDDDGTGQVVQLFHSSALPIRHSVNNIAFGSRAHAVPQMAGGRFCFAGTCAAMIPPSPLGSDSKKQPAQLTAWYDGACPLCMREIRLMRRLDRNGAINFVDLTANNATCPTDRSLLLKRFHVRAEGQLLSGAAAFAAMWRAIPLLRPLGQLARLPGVLWLLERAYLGFLRVRPMLQRLMR